MMACVVWNYRLVMSHLLNPKRYEKAFLYQFPAFPVNDYCVMR